MASLRSRRSDPVTLASELDGIVPVERLDNGNASNSEEEQSPLRLSIPSEAFREQKYQAVAPYQALPVKGPVINITQHLTPALDVIEPQRGETAEVFSSRNIPVRTEDFLIHAPNSLRSSFHIAGRRGL